MTSAYFSGRQHLLKDYWISMENCALDKDLSPWEKKLEISQNNNLAFSLNLKRDGILHQILMNILEEASRLEIKFICWKLNWKIGTFNLILKK
jgi:hypothetical protein